MSESTNVVSLQQGHEVAIKPTAEQIALIKATIAKDATDTEFKLFMYRCENMQLDPLKPGQIHFIKYGGRAGTIVIGIDGSRARANRTGKLKGIKRGILRDVEGKCIGAWAEVMRSDWDHPAREEVSLAEYKKDQANWKTMPETMIKKVAEAAALRMAFPDELGGIYIEEEMSDSKIQDVEFSQEESPSIGILQDFFSELTLAKSYFGDDCLKKFMVNKSGHTPSEEEIKTWTSEKHMKWVSMVTEKMKVEIANEDKRLSAEAE